MPRKKVPCARTRGHGGFCSSPESMENHREHDRGRKRSYDPETALRWRRSYRFAKYGLTEDQFYARLASQEGACALCSEPFEDDQVIYVDHDHACCPDEGRSCGACVRGLLCLRCNSALGHMERMWDLAEAYLLDPPGRRLGWREEEVLA
jgi:hypothetical protein